MRARPLLAVLGLLLSSLSSSVARADDVFGDLIGREQKPLIDPAGYYAVLIPPGFDCAATARQVRCHSNRGVQGDLTIDVVDVPPSATVELFVLNQSDIYKKRPHFKLIGNRKLTVDGTRALLASYTWDHNGNVELPRFVQALYVVKHTKAFVIHFEGNARTVGEHKRDLEELYASFKTARVDGGGHPIIEDLKPREVKNRDALPDVKKALKGGY
ncbi:MAG TPA: hypothetical protein VGF99_00550 [Myxococcota bacterium]